MVRISVIVPVRDDPRIDDLLSSLASQHGAPPFEVLVALDGAGREPRVPPTLSRSASCACLREGPTWPATQPRAKRGGRSCCSPIRIASAPPTGWRWPGDSSRRRPRRPFRVRHGQATTLSQLFLPPHSSFHHDRYVAGCAVVGYKRLCNTRNFAIRAAIVRKLPLPEAFPRGGDSVYGWLLEKHGIDIRYEPGWWLAHRHRESRWAEGWRAFERGKNAVFWANTMGFDLFGADRGQVLRGLETGCLSRAQSSGGSTGGLRLPPARRCFLRGSECRSSGRRRRQGVWPFPPRVSPGRPSLRARHGAAACLARWRRLGRAVFPRSSS